LRPDGALRQSERDFKPWGETLSRTVKKTDWVWKARLHLLSSAVEEPFVVDQLGSAIRRSIKRLEALEANNRSEDGWDVTDLECDRIEAMLGMSFIACQVDITSVVSRCQQFHRSGELGKAPKRIDLMKSCNEVVGKTGYTQVTAIDAFANYFKHVDEWPRDWTKIGTKTAAYNTSRTVMALGATPGCSGNMRTGFKAILRHNDYEMVMKLREIVSTWAEKLKNEYRRKLKKQGLIRSA
jgi:hypothetical protein